MLSNRIWYREFHGLYLQVSLPATELREAIETAIATGRYQKLPSAKLSGWVIPAAALGGVLVIGSIGCWLMRRRRVGAISE